MLEKLRKLLKAKEDRKAELREKVNNTDDIKELRGINIDLDELNGEISDLKSMIVEEEKREKHIENNEGGDGDDGTASGEIRDAAPIGQMEILATYGIGAGQTTEHEDQRAKLTEKYEKRGRDLKEKRAVTFSIDELPEFRAVTVGGGTLVVPSHYSNTLNEKFNEVSSLIDRVNAVPLPGGESYRKGFEVSSGEGDYTLEEGDYVEAEPTYDYVDINKAKITAYAEISDEAVKLPNINYQSLVARDISKALRKKMTKQILVGAGGTNALKGIFNAPTNVIPAASDVEVSAIDADTLDKIVFGYGGDEEVEGGAVLVLNKNDLAAFAAIRSTDGKKLYKITLNGNTGTISSDGSFSVPFVINSAAPALSAAGTAVNTLCMAYGMVMAYEMPVYSDVEVEESRDYKFKSGQIAYRGSVWAGGNVAMYKGFVRIKKVTAV